MSSFFRSKGRFGIWIRGKDTDGADDRNYIIDIPKDSDTNNLYQWNKTHENEMNLKGTFFIEKFIDSSKYAKESPSTMSQQWEEASCEGDGCNDVTVIELNPISKKEIQMKQY